MRILKTIKVIGIGVLFVMGCAKTSSDNIKTSGFYATYSISTAATSPTIAICSASFSVEQGGTYIELGTADTVTCNGQSMTKSVVLGIVNYSANLTATVGSNYTVVLTRSGESPYSASVTLPAAIVTTAPSVGFSQAKGIGLTYTWTPTVNLSNPNIINPIATTNTSTIYIVIASIGSCSARDSVVVTTVPYPIANAGADPTVCFNGSAQLNASINGNRFTWTPTSYLNNPNSLNPVSSPPRNTQYILSAYDVLGCPKPGRDTILVTVLPRVRAYAGRDTSVIVGQPLLFNGTGGINYVWSPPIGLSNTNIFNPIGIYNTSTDSVKYKLVVTDQAGCADSSFIIVRVFRTTPYVFVPTAFTPNNDGKNDVIRPISVGIQKINYFSIFNRWGQLVFTTTVDRAGWDGRIKGKPQDSGVFVWMLSAVDYTGAPIFLKGTVALIR